MSVIKSNQSGLGGSGDVGGALGSFYSHTIDQSLRFNDDDSPALSKTYGTAQTNTKIITVSVWVKRANLGIRTTIMFAKSGSSGWFNFGTDDKLYWNPYNTGYNGFKSTRVFRDTSAWYHIVATADSDTQSGANIYNVYVNGEQLTNSDGSTHVPDDTATMMLRNGVTTYIGDDTDGDYHFDGYLAEMHVIDGSVVAHTEFGETKDGVWVPKEYSGSYGNNGFYLPFNVTSGFSAKFDGTGDNIVWSSASAFDIGSSDDFCLEMFVKGDFESNYSYGFGDGAFMMQLGNNGNFYGYTSLSTSNGFDASSYLTTTNWHHVAWVRESGTYRFYIDGVQRHSATSGGTNSFDVSEFNVGDATPAAGAPHYNGHVSNLRFTIGAARYGSGTTFTVPTSTLTNDSSNVKLLAFTTSDITADGSSGSLSGSIDEGDPVLSSNNPFSDAIGNDESGNNNDYTPTLGLDFDDIVPDSPTNNFCTLNPLFSSASQAVLSEGNLKAATAGFTSSAYGYGATSTFAIPKDKKIYIEVECTDAAGDSWFAGFATKTSIETGVGGNTGSDGSITCYNRSVKINGSENDYGSSAGLGGFGVAKLAAGDILGCAIDGATGKVWFSRNGTYFGAPIGHQSGAGSTGDPSAGSNEIGTLTDGTTDDVFFVLGGGTSADNIFVNFGQDSTNIASAQSDSEGIGTFEYAPPTDYVALCSSNMSDITIGPGQSDQTTDHFDTKLWTSDVVNPAAGDKQISLDFQPDWVWSKDRAAGESHYVVDSVRGDNDGNKLLMPDRTNAEGGDAIGSTTAKYDFTSSGFDIIDTNSASGEVYYNGGSSGGARSYVGWCWKAGGAPTVDNSAGNGATPTAGSVKIDGSNLDSALAGSLAATRLSANTTAGFSIVTWTAPNDNGTVAHGLSSAPEMIIAKPLGSGTNWYVMHTPGGVVPANNVGNLDNSNAKFNPGVNHFNDTYPTSTVFSYGGYLGDDLSNDDKVAYCFHSVEGYSKVGSYEGVNSSDGVFVYLGFRARWIMIKEVDASGYWMIIDTERYTSNDGDTIALAANENSTESTINGRNQELDILSNGFKIRNSGGDIGASASHIYLAFAEAPFKFANAR